MVASRLPVIGLSHVALRVSDPEAAAAFYAGTLGLVETGRQPNGAVRLSSLPRKAAVLSHHEVILYRGAPTGLDHLALSVPDAAALWEAAALLRARGAAVLGPEDFEGVHGPSIRVIDPDGLTVELTPPPRPVSRPAGRPPFDLVKLGHVNIKSPDPPRQARWWQEVMDFRLSDQMGETFYWLRCNPDHTTVAIVRSATPGMHHIAWEVVSWEEIRRLCDHLTAQGVPIEFGPGRHGPGKSVFVYFLDPWRIRWELLCEIERIQDEAAHRPMLWDATRRAEIVNLWGPAPPPTFLDW